MNRKQAEESGAVRFLGEPCARKHRGERYTKGGACVDCVALKRGITLHRRNRSNRNDALANKARAKGLKTYVPVKPCHSGHFERWVESNNCLQCDESQRQKHVISKRFSRIRKLYGLGKDDYLKLVNNQNSSCKLCTTYFENHFSLHVDHCHESGKVRGLLCSKCNQAIGLLNHSPELMRKAANYCK